MVFIYLCILYFLFLIVYYAYPISVQLIRLNKFASSMPFLKTGIVYLIKPIASLISMSMVLERILALFIQKEGE